MTVKDVLEYLAGGMTVDEILNDFPDLTREDIRACLEFAADREGKNENLLQGTNGMIVIQPVKRLKSATLCVNSLPMP